MTTDLHPPAQSGRPAIALGGAIALARGAVESFTGQTIDAVAACSRLDTGWRLLIDVVEAPARLGDNDLLATFEIELDAAGEVVAFRRTARYNRSEVAR